jgi:hypothetical protein
MSTATTTPTKLPLKYFVLNPAGTTPDAVAARAALLTYAAAIKSTEPETSDLIVGWVAWLETQTTTSTTTTGTETSAAGAAGTAASAKVE